MTIKHPFDSPKADGADATLVRPSNWDASHNAPDFLLWILNSVGTINWADMPAVLTELLAKTHYRSKADLTYVTQVRLVGRVVTAGAASAQLRLQWSTDESAWDYLDGATGPAIALGSTGQKASSWVSLVAGAMADIILRPVGIDGDGAADPEFANLQLWGR